MHRYYSLNYVSITSIVLLMAFIICLMSNSKSYALDNPSWWSNTDCDTAHYSNAYKLGSSYNGVLSCGPRPIADSGKDLLVRFYPGAYGHYEWECVELSMRYMYLAYGINPYDASGGKDVVPNYNGTTLLKVNNDGKSLPSPGDILSIAATATNNYGHTGVVSGVNVSNGTGTVTILEQNSSASGNSTINVSSGKLANNVSSWLHNPKADLSYVSFQSNTNNLFTYTDSGVPTNQGMSSGSSPATAVLSDLTYRTAFRANTGELRIWNSATGQSEGTNQGIADGTSPAITGFTGTGWQVVFQGADGYLHGFDSSGNSQMYSQLVAPSTSPSIASLVSGGWRIAYQSRTGYLNLYSVTPNGSGNVSLNQGMSTKTSPSISGLNGSTWIAAFQANTGNAFVYNSAIGYGQDLGLGMSQYTSPSIAGFNNSRYKVAAQANTGQLYIRNSENGYNTNLSQGLYQGASPNVVRLSDDNYKIAFQANTGSLVTYTVINAGTPTGQGMAASTVPSIALPLPAN